MSASIQSDSDHLLESEADHSLPERQVIDHYNDSDYSEDGGMPLDEDLPSISPPEPSTKPGSKIQVSEPPGALSERTVPILQDNPHAQELSYHTRTNRWYGADSTWLSWTEDERLIAQSLDRGRSQELGLHLFNAHVLNAHSKQSKETMRKRIKGKAPIRLGSELKGSQDETLVPPRGWTAWPLPPDQVPRESLIPHTDRDKIYRVQDDTRPSAGLEDCIIATTTRLARNRWEARAWQPEFSSKRQWGIKVEDGEADVAMDEDCPQSPSEASAEESDAVETVISVSDSDSDNPGDQLFMSQAYDLAFGDGMAEDAKQDAGSNDGPVDERRPVPIADDDKARDLLLPGTRHILGKLDDLLMGLHKARQAYAATSLLKKRGRHAEGGTNTTTDVESANSESSAPGRKRKRRRAGSIAPSVSMASGSTVSEENESGRNRYRQPGTRDWSDVVGMASLIGWNVDIVERASQRCASLFGENMLFRAFHEGNKSMKQVSYFTEHMALDEEEASGPEADMKGSTGMVRTSQACVECHRLKERCEAQGQTEGRSDCKRCIDCGLKCSGITVKIYINIGRSCPYKDCERHSIPFRKGYHLQRHLDTVHEYDSLPSRLSTITPGPTVKDTPQATEIVCPVLTCPRNKQPFSRGKKLYEHIRIMHPEVDIEEVKKLEAARRGEKRGRYRDESRRREVGRANRSRSKSVFSEPAVGSDED